MGTVGKLVRPTETQTKSIVSGIATILLLVGLRYGFDVPVEIWEAIAGGVFNYIVTYFAPKNEPKLPIYLGEQ